jgi:hypothetical protein
VKQEEWWQKMIPRLNSKQRRTLEEIFKSPTSSNIKSDEVKSLIEGIGGYISTKGRTCGARIRLIVGKHYAKLHDPHPSHVFCKAAIKDLRKFYEKIGVMP